MHSPHGSLQAAAQVLGVNLSTLAIVCHYCKYSGGGGRSENLFGKIFGSNIVPSIPYLERLTKLSKDELSSCITVTFVH
jgi:hypothetical protein